MEAELELAAIGGLAWARSLSWEEAQLYRETHNYRRRVFSLQEALANLSPPYAGENGPNLKEAARWQDDYDELWLSIAQEDCCMHEPLDSPYGERLDPPALDHWRSRLKERRG